MKEHDFTFTLSTGLPVRIYVEEYDRTEWTVLAEMLEVKQSIEIPECDIDEINFLAERHIESARHANDDRLFEEWKESKMQEVSG